ncbi:MAG: MarR family transcriptional regulator [Methanothrix sp.]|nr:MarR family transcriptional regulator [Methanothrix sp.]
MFRDLSGEDAHDFRSDACEVNLPGASDVLRDAISKKIREEIGELKLEILLLKEEVLKNRQRIISLESKKNRQGKEVRRRVDSMLLLLIDYGGSLTSSSVKAYMGLSKDELYRTLKCAREEGLVEALPDPHDRRGYILNIKTDNSEIMRNH